MNKQWFATPTDVFPLSVAPITLHRFLILNSIEHNVSRTRSISAGEGDDGTFSFALAWGPRLRIAIGRGITHNGVLSYLQRWGGLEISEYKNDTCYGQIRTDLRVCWMASLRQ